MTQNSERNYLSCWLINHSFICNSSLIEQMEQEPDLTEHTSCRRLYPHLQLQNTRSYLNNMTCSCECECEKNGAGSMSNCFIQNIYCRI